MKLSCTRFKVFISYLVLMAFAVSFVGCSSSKTKTGSDTNAKVSQPVTGGQEQTKKTETPSSKDFEKLLTAAEVEQVSGIKGIKLIPKNPQVGAGGNLNFGIENDKPILAVMVADKDMFSSWKTNKNLNAAAVPGLGDEAFRGVADSNMYTPNVTFIKGGQAIQLFTFFNMNNDMKPYLDHEKLIKLAKIIEGHM